MIPFDPFTPRHFLENLFYAMIEAANSPANTSVKSKSRSLIALLENIQSAVRALTLNPFRSSLTLLGIVIGVISIVTLVAILQGVKAEISKQVEGLGANLVMIVPSKLDEDGNPNMMAMMGVSSLNEKDIDALKAVPGVVKISPIMFVSGTVEQEATAGKKRSANSAFVVATYREGIEMNPTPLSSGRYFTKEEEDQNVCVLAEKPRKEMFGTEDAVGKSVTISGQKWKVVGTLANARGSEGLGSQLLALNHLIYVPVKSALREIPGVQINRIGLQTDYLHPADKMVSQMSSTLLTSHNQHENFGILTQQKGLSIVIKFVSLAQSLLVLIAAISLFVAGIGIMNIMLVTVTERTREIGIRKTVGARKLDIFVQFLTEAIVLSLIGGGVGILSSQLLCVLIGRLSLLKPIITLPVVGMAIGVCMTVGIVFGVAPAIRAAALDPIDALRHE